MFKHRLTKFGVSSLLAMLLFVGGSLQSCKDWLDVYPYDDPGDPEWLGASVYDFLKEGTPNHSYNNFVAIIDSLGYKDVLAHTGSKTLFVADDAAFERFFKNGENIWNVNSVGEMTKSQMKTILYGAMLDNSMLLDMLASSNGAMEKENEDKVLRRQTSLDVIDTIPLVTPDYYEHHKNWPVYNEYWDVIRGQERTSIRLAMDNSRPMMVHFLRDYLRNNSIQASDIEFLFTKHGKVQKTYADGDAFIYGNKIVSNDIDAGSYSDDTLTIICKNGYVYRLDDLLLPPSNMAEELRKRSDTRIFSHLLDRFCVPVLDQTLTNRFKEVYNMDDKVYKLCYLNKVEDRLDNETKKLLDAANKNPESLLGLDPGDNDLKNEGANLKLDKEMAAMFVPSDEVLYKYFESGSGHFLLERYAPDVEIAADYSYDNVDVLLLALDSVKQDNIEPFLSNLIKSSFISCVKSRFSTVSNDAHDPMGIEPEHVDECVIANNGVIYIMNTVFGPAEYEAVHSPTLVFENMEIMKYVIKQMTYDYYLLAMQAKYSLIIPSDEHFVYSDPLSVVRDDAGKVQIDKEAKMMPRVYEFHYDNKMSLEEKQTTKTGTRFWHKVYEFDPATYKLGEKIIEEAKDYTVADGKQYFGGAYNSELPVRMGDMLSNLVVVHNGDEEFTPDVKYYLTKGYATIKVDASDPNNIKIQGGEQLERDTYVVVESKNDQKNGVAYCTVPGEVKDGYVNSAIPTPATRSVYDNLKRKSSDKFSEFYNLCYPGYDIASKDENGNTALQKLITYKNANLYDSAKRYTIFFTNTTNSNGYTKLTVPFFNVFHYTVYVPSNESIKDMYKKGLPTWKQVDEVILAGDTTKANPKAAAMARSILDFAKYHFQDNAIYVDNSQIATFDVKTGTYIPGKKFATAVMDSRTNRFYELDLMRNGENFTITDDLGNVRTVVITPDGVENKDWNIMCRDNTYKTSTTGPVAQPKEYLSSSYAVLQPIDGVLLNRSMFGYDGNFKRFAANGCTVDTMYVNGTGAVNINGDNVSYNSDVTVDESQTGGRNYYLVASAGRLEITDLDGKTKVHKAGYLMQHIDEGDSEYMEYVTNEKLYYRSYKEVLITDEGYGIVRVETEDKKGKVTVTYEYATKQQDGKIYKIKYTNDNKQELQYVCDAAPEEEGNN